MRKYFVILFLGLFLVSFTYSDGSSLPFPPICLGAQNKADCDSLGVICKWTAVGGECWLKVSIELYLSRNVANKSALVFFRNSCRRTKNKEACEEMIGNVGGLKKICDWDPSEFCLPNYSLPENLGTTQKPAPWFRPFWLKPKPLIF